MKFTFLLLLIPLLSHGQLIRYNQADTLVERITAPFYVSRKLVYFDTSYYEKRGSGTVFKIGKVCAQFGCDGGFDSTGKSQASWWLLENKIVICYLTQISVTEWRPELKVWRYKHLTGRFILIL